MMKRIILLLALCCAQIGVARAQSTGYPASGTAPSYGADTGAVNVLAVSLSPCPTVLANGAQVALLPANTNTTTTPTLNVCGLGAKTITRLGAAALVAGDITTTALAQLTYNLGSTRWELQNPQTAIMAANPALASTTAFGTAIRVVDQPGWNGINSDVNQVIANICIAYGGNGVHISVGGGMLQNGAAAASYGWTGSAKTVVLFGSNVNPAVACAASLGSTSISMRVDLDGAAIVTSSTWDTSQNNFMIDGGAGYPSNGGNWGSILIMCPLTAGCGPNNYPAWGSGGVLNPTVPVYNNVAGPPFYSPVINTGSPVSNDYCAQHSLTCSVAAFSNGATSLSVSAGGAGIPIAALTVDSVLATGSGASTVLCSQGTNCEEGRISSAAITGGAGGFCTTASPCTVGLQNHGGINGLSTSGAQTLFLYQANSFVAIRMGYMEGQFATNCFDQQLKNFDIDLEGASASFALSNESCQERTVIDGVHPTADWELFPDTSTHRRTLYNAYYSTTGTGCYTATTNCLTAGPVGGGILFQKTWQGAGDTAGPEHYIFRNGAIDAGAEPNSGTGYCGGTEPCQTTSAAVTITYPAATGYIPQCNDGNTARWCPVGTILEAYSWLLNNPSTASSAIMETGTNEGKVTPKTEWPIAHWIDGVQRGVFEGRAEHTCTLYDVGELPPATYPGDLTSDLVFLSPSSCFEECTSTTSQYANEGSTRVAKTDIELGKNSIGPNHIIGLNSCTPAGLYGIVDTVNGNFVSMAHNNPNAGNVSQVGEYKHDAQTSVVTNANPYCGSGGAVLTVGQTCTDVLNGIVEYASYIMSITGGVVTASFGNGQGNGLGGSIPALTAAVTGTNAPTVLNVVGIAGGATSNASGTGGVGSPVSISGGIGGAGTGTNSGGGAGGPLNFTAGAGAAGLGTSANAFGGNILLTPGAPGSGGSGLAGTPGSVIFANGTCASPKTSSAASLEFANDNQTATEDTGFMSATAGKWTWCYEGSKFIDLTSVGFEIGNGLVYGFSSTGGSEGSQDTALSRIAAGYAGIGTGAQGSVAGYLKTGMTLTLAADWSCGTGGTVSTCASAVIIGSTAATPLTFTLPLISTNWHFDCDFVVGQATAVTANQWNLLTATNGVTSTTAMYQMATAATAYAGGAATDVASTTTTFQILPSWTLGAAGTKMPVHIAGTLTGASASGTVFSLQLLAPTIGDLVTIYEGSGCSIHP